MARVEIMEFDSFQILSILAEGISSPGFDKNSDEGKKLVLLAQTMRRPGARYINAVHIDADSRPEDCGVAYGSVETVDYRNDFLWTRGIDFAPGEKYFRIAYISADTSYADDAMPMLVNTFFGNGIARILVEFLGTTCEYADLMKMGAEVLSIDKRGYALSLKKK